MYNFSEFLEPINVAQIANDEPFLESQLGQHVTFFETNFPDISEAEIIIIGCEEQRGASIRKPKQNSADAVRQQLYKLFYWHKDVTIADIGNIKTGATIEDSYAALTTVVAELIAHNKKVLIIGGSHDLTQAQLNAYANNNKIVEATCVDAFIDLNMDSQNKADNFLMEMLTGEPNFVKHYNHIGFQSYYVHPQMLETIDKLRFDCYRLGKVKEGIEEMEPCIRNSHLLSFDISALQYAHAPTNTNTPNGFNGEEACTLMQYAGMSTTLSSIGVYGFIADNDIQNVTAKQLSQMIWYFIDGVYKGKNESIPTEESNAFDSFDLITQDFETTFLKNKFTGRWWMKMYDGKYAACTYTDYYVASKNEIPERWLRAMERSV